MPKLVIEITEELKNELKRSIRQKFGKIRGFQSAWVVNAIKDKIKKQKKEYQNGQA